MYYQREINQCTYITISPGWDNYYDHISISPGWDPQDKRHWTWQLHQLHQQVDLMDENNDAKYLFMLLSKEIMSLTENMNKPTSHLVQH